MSAASPNENSGAAIPNWIEVPIKRHGLLGAAIELLEYFGYFVVTALCLFAAWCQLTGEFNAPSSDTRRPPGWAEGPAGLLVSLPVALVCGMLFLIRALDVLTPAVVFEGKVTELQLKDTRGPRIPIRDWFIDCGTQRWQIQAADAPNLRKWADAGKTIRITYTSANRRVLRLEVAIAPA